VTFVRLTDSYHMITLDNERDTVAEQTLAFVQRA
jgi:carboxylesterase